MLYALQDISSTYITKAKEISDDLLKNSALKQNTAPEVNEFLTKIKEFEEKYSECTGIEELFQLVVSFSTTTSDYYEREENKTLKDEEKVILDVLKHSKVHEIDNDFEKTFMNFATKFAHKMEAVKEDLKTEKIGDKILKWWEDVKDIKDYDEKMEAFAKFTKLYEKN